MAITKHVIHNTKTTFKQSFPLKNLSRRSLQKKNKQRKHTNMILKQINAKNYTIAPKID